MKRHQFPCLACVIFMAAIAQLPIISAAKDLKHSAISLTSRDSKWLDANQIAMMVMNNGTLARHPQTGNAAFVYPKKTDKTAMYVAGLWFAGKVNGEIRTACADYNTEYQPGIILPNGKPDNPELAKYRVYKIRRGDSADPTHPQYNKDYAEWPIAQGAPVDEQGQPLILGDQTLWCVMNDGNEALHNTTYGTKPLNIEVQLLAWAHDDSTALGKTIFLHYTIINKGSENISDAYIGIYVDPDLGDANDDEIACDTTLNLAYVYNGKNVDAMYGAEVPAVGLCLLQGPAIPSPGETALQFHHAPLWDKKLLPLTSNSPYY
ncbi:MAG: hypothetical protein ONB16_03175 [candidate division KSB1 bacterium]|nr:hypothetical protein [candidate division KSB1 bacterium]MDZ7317630.1 hypothetical protein [candidate division KSB1 bacterium]MDZ7340847.1 hypothetical protein [candidate division KSB1 bacterium]